MEERFLEELRNSGWLHRPLPLPKENSLEAEFGKRRVWKRKNIWSGPKDGSFVSLEEGRVWHTAGEEPKIHMEGRLTQERWPKGMPQDGDCAYYGNLRALLYLEEQDWREYNRLHFWVYPCCKGLHTISLAVWLKNQGEEPVPDIYGRTGQHMMNLENRTWNECFWELGGLGRDKITELEFRCRLSGSDTKEEGLAGFQIRDICLEKTQEEKEWGWRPEKNRIALDFNGYSPWEKKTAVADSEKGIFQVVEADMEKVVLEKEVLPACWKGEWFGILDFSELKEEGRYKLRLSGKETETFRIGKDWLEEMLWKGLNFIFCQRCGCLIPGKHGLCHEDCYGVRGKEQVSYCGGWHDAGDMSQQTVQTAETAEELFLLAEACEEKKELYHRLMEEALWGLAFVEKTRFGDGFRASSLGLIRWTDGRRGNLDDGANVRVQAHALDQFICACAQAEAALALRKYDPEQAEASEARAREDYAFAKTRFEKYGLEATVMWEHTYGAGESLLFGAAGKAAALLWEVSKKEPYREDALKWGKRLLDCQEQTGKIRGYFYRDEKRVHIAHFNHQARERYYGECLRRAWKLAEREEDKAAFWKGLTLYGDYLELLMEHASPYGMFPAGIYEMREAEDRETFQKTHLLCSYQDCKEDYQAQVRAGEKLEEQKYLRQFPVWFSFRGNLNVQLSMGQSALEAGIGLRRQRLTQAALEQLHWINGKNPFCQSLMTGSGKRYNSLYAVFPGQCVGACPVGIQTKKNEDIPFWPQGNQATAREVWISSTIKMMSICGKLLKN